MKTIQPQSPDTEKYFRAVIASAPGPTPELVEQLRRLLPPVAVANRRERAA